jgi:hypothetical protein
MYNFLLFLCGMARPVHIGDASRNALQNINASPQMKRVPLTPI